MPQVAVEAGIQLHYAERGEGEETVVFSHSYLVDHRHFEPQLEALKSRYRVLAYDHRGHGQSDKPSDGYSMERIYADGVAFLEALETGPVHWIGLSAGGFVGMRIAFRRPELLKSLVLMDTAAGEPVFNRIKYRTMLLMLGSFGFGPLLGSITRSMFGRAFLKDPARAEERTHWRQRFRDNDIKAIIGFGKAIFSRDDVTNQLRDIALPTLVVVGEDDHGTPPDKARHLAATIPGARLEVIPNAGHLCTVEQPDEVNRVLFDFLAEQKAWDDAARQPNRYGSGP